jgi:DegV family protein with EDD domain
MTVGIVTDSTAYLPEAIVSALAIEVVPVQVIVDGVAYDEFRHITVDEVVAALRNGKKVTTSRPNPDQFLEAYRRLAQRGFDSIVSVHLSSHLSGTYESAVLASKESPVPVNVIDSGGVAAMIGHAALAGARLAKSGADLDTVTAEVEQRCAASSIEFYVDTLEFLQRTGRISNMRSRVGTVLSVKPILHMVNGQVVQHELVRTASKAVERLVELVADGVTGPCEIAVHHVDAAARADQVAQRLCETLNVPSVTVTPAGAVIAAHVGPGAVAVVITQ